MKRKQKIEDNSTVLTDTMEIVTSTETATMKKKRNRSQKKSNLIPVNNAEHQLPTNNAQQATAVEKENNRPSKVSVANVGDRQEEGTDHTVTAVSVVGELSRKPSRRRKRKPKTANGTKCIGSGLEAVTLDELSPVDHIDAQVQGKGLAVQQSLTTDLGKPRNFAVSTNPLIIDAKHAGIVDLHYSHFFPRSERPDSVINNISLDEIFPGSDVFSFNETEIPFGKLNSTELSAAEETSKKKQILTGILSLNGLSNITTAQLFPNNTLIGLKQNSEHVEEFISKIDHPPQQLGNAAKMSASAVDQKVEKNREEILAERQAKKTAKLAARNKNKDKAGLPNTQPEKQIPAKTKAPQGPAVLAKSDTDGSICEKLKDLHISDAPVRSEQKSGSVVPKTSIETKELSKAERKAQFDTKNLVSGKKDADVAKAVLSKADRRAIQEAQRAAKAEAQQAKTKADAAKKSTPQKCAGSLTGAKQIVKKSVPLGVVGAGGPPRKHIVNLFNHLHQPKFAAAEIVNSPTLHPAATKLGIQYAEGAVVGSKARCLALLKMLNQLIHDFETPPEKEFGRSFEETLNTSAIYLQRCRPFSVSMTNALRHVKMYTRQLDGKVSDSEQKECLLESIESYIRDHIEKAEEAICISVQEKIYHGDVILTYGCSSLIKHILEEANRRSKNFRVIIVNARPRGEENAMLEHLVQQGVKCTCVLINAVSYVMPEVTKVLLGAHALLANGSVMSRVGTAQIALVAKSYNVPVLVCCETHKFTERVQTDAFVYNEIGNPNDLILAPRTRDPTEGKPMLADWETLTSLTILNLHYDVTPPELVTAVVTEVAILPCTSVPVILRIKPSDVTY